jgi:hypothetical protein
VSQLSHRLASVRDRSKWLTFAECRVGLWVSVAVEARRAVAVANIARVELLGGEHLHVAAGWARVIATSAHTAHVQSAQLREREIERKSEIRECHQLAWDLRECNERLV